jgi:hypothetical protein
MHEAVKHFNFQSLVPFELYSSSHPCSARQPDDVLRARRSSSSCSTASERQNSMAADWRVGERRVIMNLRQDSGEKT